MTPLPSDDGWSSLSEVSGDSHAPGQHPKILLWKENQSKSGNICRRFSVCSPLVLSASRFFNPFHRAPVQCFLCVPVQMLVIFRNPKDTLVSFFHFSNNNPVLPSGQSWDTFYSDFMSGDGEKKTRLSCLFRGYLDVLKYIWWEVWWGNRENQSAAGVEMMPSLHSVTLSTVTMNHHPQITAVYRGQLFNERLTHVTLSNSWLVITPGLFQVLTRPRCPWLTPVTAGPTSYLHTCSTGVCTAHFQSFSAGLRPELWLVFSRGLRHVSAEKPNKLAKNLNVLLDYYWSMNMWSVTKPETDTATFFMK